jgi:cell division protein ZapE
LRQSVSAAYHAKIRDHSIEPDEAQQRLAERFDVLIENLHLHRPFRKPGPLGWVLGRRKAPSAPTGLYIWGSVGRGKTMLMDLFFEAAPVQHKRRVHFHAFMAEVHARIHVWRQQKRVGAVKGDDPIGPLADELISQAWLLCFDEFAVTDIADAMLLGRLFTALFERGLVVVATSNVEPSRLYEGGLNRALFLPFIALLTRRMEVFELSARTDFRLEKLNSAPVYYTPADEQARTALDRAFHALTGHETGAAMKLPVLGREVLVPQSASNVARFSFADLCGRPLGSADYLAIAENFHTVFVDDVPVMLPHMRNEAKRFINFIDTLYDQHVKLVVSADSTPVSLCVGDGREAFEFERTASRLIEMQSHDYLALPHGRADSTASGDTTGLADT